MNQGQRRENDERCYLRLCSQGGSLLSRDLSKMRDQASKHQGQENSISNLGSCFLKLVAILTKQLMPGLPSISFIVNSRCRENAFCVTRKRLTEGRRRLNSISTTQKRKMKAAGISTTNRHGFLVFIAFFSGQLWEAELCNSFFINRILQINHRIKSNKFHSQSCKYL